HITVILVSCILLCSSYTLFSTDTPPSASYTLSLHDALPIWADVTFYSKSSTLDIAYGPHPVSFQIFLRMRPGASSGRSETKLDRSEEHTSELQSRRDLVCRLLLEKKKVE